MMWMTLDVVWTTMPQPCNLTTGERRGRRRHWMMRGALLIVVQTPLLCAVLKDLGGGLVDLHHLLHVPVLRRLLRLLRLCVQWLHLHPSLFSFFTGFSFFFFCFCLIPAYLPKVMSRG